MKKKRVLIVDDHPIVRHGLIQLLKETGEFKPCGEAEDAAQARRKVEKLQPDLVILDFFLKGEMALETIKGIRAAHPRLPILVISLHADPTLAERALEAGAGGFLLKDEDKETILQAVRTILEGKTFISPKLYARLFRKMAIGEQEEERKLVDKLSDRELQVFHLIAEGNGNAEIAARLGINIKTVETLVARIKVKLHLKSSRELTRYAAIRISRAGDSGSPKT